MQLKCFRLSDPTDHWTTHTHTQFFPTSSCCLGIAKLNCPPSQQTPQTSPTTQHAGLKISAQPLSEEELTQLHALTPATAAAAAAAQRHFIREPPDYILIGNTITPRPRSTLTPPSPNHPLQTSSSSSSSLQSFLQRGVDVRVNAEEEELGVGGCEVEDVEEGG